MADTKLISPGIPNYTLKRNLRLNDKYISNDGGDEGIRIDNDGFVGMGTDDPDAPLDIKADVVDFIHFDRTANGGVSTIYEIKVASTDKMGMGRDGYDDLYINSSGNMGIGTGSQNTKLTIARLGGVGDASLVRDTAGDGIVADVELGRISFGSDDPINDTFVYGAAIAGIAESTWDTNDCPARLVFYTADDGSNTLNPRMTILENGNVGIGVTDPASPLEIFNTASQLKISYNENNYADISVADNGELELATTGTNADINLDAGDDIFLDVGSSSNGSIHFKAATTERIYMNFTNTTNELKIKGGTQAADYFTITTGIEAATTIATVSGDTSIAHLTVVADGHVEFDGCAVGFDKEIAAFSTSPIDSDANDSTDVDFRLGNKFELTLTDDISGTSEFINLIFPATSGNFILVLIQGNADCTVEATGWVAYQSDGSTKATNAAATNLTDGRLRWAGGSAPTLSTAQYDVDIISFYWDADNQTAFGVPSLEFK